MRADPPQAERFVCLRCGHCCRVAGWVRLRDGEAERIARLLGLKTLDFTSRYTVLSADRSGLVLTERDDGACIFLDQDQTCMIQDAKPGQCQDYPRRWQRVELDAQCAGRAARR